MPSFFFGWLLLDLGSIRFLKKKGANTNAEPLGSSKNDPGLCEHKCCPSKPLRISKPTRSEDSRIRGFGGGWRGVFLFFFSDSADWSRRGIGQDTF